MQNYCEDVVPGATLNFVPSAFAFDLGGLIDGTGSLDTSGVDGPVFSPDSLFAPPLGPPLFSDPPPDIWGPQLEW